MARVTALYARTGAPSADFGQGGEVKLALQHGEGARDHRNRPLVVCRKQRHAAKAHGAAEPDHTRIREHVGATIDVLENRLHDG